MMICAGVDGCKVGWVSARRDGPHVAFALHPDFAALAAALPSGTLIAVDMPIGLPERITGAGRAAEQAVRPLLKRKSGSVFSMVSRGAVMADEPYADTCRIARATSDPSRALSRQGFNILPKVREVDAALRNDALLASRVRETHPEVVLTMLAGAPVMASKKSREGAAERREILHHAGLVLPDPLPRIAGAAADDLVDAAICLLAAERILGGVARPFPSPPARDACGLPIAIWA
jgi:predicted RNase H-like nuclease